MAAGNPLVPPRQGHPLSSPLETILGHRFARPALLREALTHRSAAERRGRGSNERLEFMGDRVLGLLIAEWLVERFPHEQEGQLGPRLAELVAQPALTAIAETIGLAEALAVAPGEARAGLRARGSVLADALEATIGALYLDGGLDTARNFVRKAWTTLLDEQTKPPKDAKTTLQEWAQKRGHPLPHYTTTNREGPPHAPHFTVTVTAGPHSASATAPSKRAAEQAAAASLLQTLAAS
ncbi:MAG: ribonuclease III [Rhodospirillales bacterium]|nr:ribonuclease III [Rhodospirillales bacterium]